MYGPRLENLIAHIQPPLALRGQTHKTCHRTIGETWIGNNPRGYAIENSFDEKNDNENWKERERKRLKLLNSNFDPYFTRKIGKKRENIQKIS